MARSLTVGVKPTRMAYKGGMSLEMAYEQLGLRPPLDWELSNSLDPEIGWGFQGKRRTGSSLQMLIEMYLDADQANRQVGLYKRHLVRFLCITLHRDQSRQLFQMLQNIHEQLAKDVQLTQIEFLARERLEKRRFLADFNFRSWSVFCDHAVKEHEGTPRNEGPFRYTREFRRVDANLWEALDRDGETIGLVQDLVQAEILLSSPCPITMTYPNRRVLPVTYPGFVHDEINRFVTLRRAFVL